MTTRKVLQEIPVLLPKTEQQSYVLVTDEEMEVPSKPIFSPCSAHAKYISDDESKENITPTEFDSNTVGSYKLTLKAAETGAGEPADVSRPDRLENQESCSTMSDNVCLAQESHNTSDMARGVGSVTPSKCDTEAFGWHLGAPTSPMDFSKLTVETLGISSDSFTSKCAGSRKSPKMLQKYRRRSTIGVRGSPATNLLIRQIALQRSQRTEPETPISPFLSPRNLTLKKKISSFQNTFQAVEECEGKLSFPGSSEEENEVQHDAQQSYIHGKKLESSEPPEKRRRLCDASLLEILTSPLRLQAPLFTQLQENAKKVPQDPVLDKISEFDASAISAGFKTGEVKSTETSATCQKRKVMFAGIPSSLESDSHSASRAAMHPALKKTLRTELGRPVDGLGGRNSVSCSLPELSENDESILLKKPVSDFVKKKKQVTFGRQLSPELFDKSLPANTPLRRGSTPNHKLDTTTPTALETNSLSAYEPLPQPDFDCKDENTLQALTLHFDTEPLSTEYTSTSSDNDDQVLPIKTLEDETLQSDARKVDEPSLISNDLLEDTVTATTMFDTDIVNETFKAPEQNFVLDSSRVTRSANKIKISSDKFHLAVRAQEFSGEPSSSVDPLTHASPETAETNDFQVTGKAKTISRRSRKPVVKKAEVKASRGNGKKSRRRPKKSVQKPLYGKRETVSKKPLLSPIPELPESFPMPSASIPHLGRGTIGKSQENHIHLETLDSSTSMVRKIDDADRLEQDKNIHHRDSVTDGQNETEPSDLIIQDYSLSTECLLPYAGKEMEQIKMKSEPMESVKVTDLKVRDAVETILDVKSANKAKKHSMTRKRVLQTTTDWALMENAEILDINLSSTDNVKHKNSELNAENPKPVIDALLAEDAKHSSELSMIIGTAGKKKGRPSKSYRRSASLCPIPEPNIQSSNSFTMLPDTDENVTTLPSDVCLPIDEIFQSNQEETKVRRSMRLRRGSGVTGLCWIQENKVNEKTSRRKSFSSMVKFIESPKLLEGLTHSPNEESMSVYPEPSAVKKVRRRTLCTSSLQETTLLSNTKRRRSNISYKASTVPSVETNTAHSIVSLEI